MWNYRVLKGKDNTFGLYETMYNDNKEIIAHDEVPIIVGESVQELKDTLGLMLSDIDKCQDDVLDLDKITFAPMYDPDEEFVEMDFEEFMKTVNDMDFND